MRRTVVLSLAGALVACGTRSDLIYREQIAPFFLQKPDILQPPAADDAWYRALWIDGAHVWVGGATKAYSAAIAEALDATHWNGFYFDPHLGLGEVRRMWGAAPDAIWATAGHTLLTFDGTAWLDDVDVTTEFADVSGTSKDDVWAVGQGVVVHRTHDGWSASHPISTSTNWTSVSADHSGGAFAVAPDALVHVAADGSVDLGTMPASLVAPSIAASAQNEAWLVGNDASGRAVVAWGDGKSWQNVEVPRDATLSVVRVVSRDDVWIGGSATFQWNGDALREARCEDGGALVSQDIFVTTSELWVLGRCSTAATNGDDVLRWKLR